ncbi:MAG: NTP transferase domain-containing protein [Prevotella sp.]|nr:NTP transferase domain-containing protein [Prevotella sp.]
MKFAIIAAGEGSRLQQEGINDPKPLVSIHGEHLIDRLMRIFMENDAEEIVVICNNLTTLVSSHLTDIQENGLNGKRVPLRFIVKSTPSSMHSFYELSRYLEDGEAFVLTTVDTIFREQEFKKYVETFRKVVKEGEDGLMGVTDFIDDEKPLYVETEGSVGASGKCQGTGETSSPQTNILEERVESSLPRITGFLDATDEPQYISGGIYGLTPRAIKTLHACIDRGESRMRNFQRGLIRDGLKLRAYPFSKVLDIDHASDIAKAEAFLKEV